MFLREHARSQRVGCVVGQHGHDGLLQNRADVEFGRHTVHGAARELAAFVDRALVRMQTGGKRAAARDGC